MSTEIRNIDTIISDSRLVNSIEEIQDCLTFFYGAKAVVWYYDAIEFYSIESGIWNLALRNWDEIVRLRVFDKERELHLWRSNGNLKGRLRDDTKGDRTNISTARLVMNGTSFYPITGGVLAKEDKGVSYNLPFPELRSVINSDKRIFLETRNYIGYSEIGQAGYTDCRFINISL